MGLQHKDIKIYIEKELNSWKKNAVDGHFIGNRPWVDYQEEVKSMLSKLLGSSQKEIAVMNSLSVNLHLLMVSFYRPDKLRSKLSITEKEIGGVPNSSEDMKQAHAAAIESYIDENIGFNNDAYGNPICVGARKVGDSVGASEAVSYTHQTLPTISRV